MIELQDGKDYQVINPEVAFKKFFKPTNALKTLPIRRLITYYPPPE